MIHICKKVEDARPEYGNYIAIFSYGNLTRNEIVHHMVGADKKKKAIKRFMEQQEFRYETVKQIEYEPIFKNMYRIRQKYDWDYAEASHSIAIG